MGLEIVDYDYRRRSYDSHDKEQGKEDEVLVAGHGSICAPQCGQLGKRFLTLGICSSQ
jgi:hypothetical protein